MESNFSNMHLKMFNDKVKLMNQSNNKNLVLSATEARSLQAEIYDLLNYCANLSRKTTTTEEVINVVMDGGSYK